MSGYLSGQILFVGAAGVLVLIGGAIAGHVPAMLLGLAATAVGAPYVWLRSRT